jgi:hypothetical protein
MTHDFDNLIEMKLVPYDAVRAQDVVRALIDLCEDADRQRALRASETLDAKKAKPMLDNSPGCGIVEVPTTPEFRHV